MRIRTCCLNSETFMIYMHMIFKLQQELSETSTYQIIILEVKSTYIYLFKIINSIRFPLTKKL